MALLRSTLRPAAAFLLAGFVLCGWLCGCAAGAAAEQADGPVKVRQGAMSVRWFEGEPVYKTKPTANSANFIQWNTRQDKGPRKFQTVELENRYLRLVICPEAGGPVARAVYKPSGADMFYLSGVAGNDNVSWTSGVKASFPYKEHGIRLPDQPASWRVVRHDDGSATVAMWMEFSRFDGPWNAQMFGRYGSMLLSQHVTLRPGEAGFTRQKAVSSPGGEAGWPLRSRPSARCRTYACCTEIGRVYRT